VITRFTTDPVEMQVLHLAIALGVWVLIWRLSPFRPVVLGAFRGQPALRERAARLRLGGAVTFGRQASAEFNQFDMPLHFAIGAFVPFFSPFVGDVLHKFGGSGCRSCRLTFLTDPVSQLLSILGGGSGNLLLQAAVLALPILALLTGKIEVFDLKIYLAIDR
jgi:hypothetical protein